MLQWNEKFEIGQLEIDSQHKMLVDYTNRLESLAHITNPDRQEVEFLLNLVDFVEQYTQSHFAYEENCMARYRCPAYAANRAAHLEFSQYFRAFKHRFEVEGCRPELLKGLYETCRNWVQTHIFHLDMQLKPCLKNPPAADPPA